MSDHVSFRYRFLPDRACEEISAGVRALVGFPPSAFLEAPSFFFDIVHPQETPILMQVLMGSMGKGRLRWMRADGSPVWVEMTAAPVWSEGQLVAAVGEVRPTSAPPGRCGRYRPVCVGLREGGGEG